VFNQAFGYYQIRFLEYLKSSVYKVTCLSVYDKAFRVYYQEFGW
jgi:hypothetical protein